MLTCINNAAWIAYFVALRLDAAIVPATAAVLFSGALAGLLMRRGQRVTPTSAVAVAAWSCLLALIYVAFGPVQLGGVLAAAFAVQVTPSIWTAYRSPDDSGVSAGTWLLILAELACFGLFGIAHRDVRLIVLGWTGVTASMLMLVRHIAARV